MHIFPCDLVLVPEGPIQAGLCHPHPAIMSTSRAPGAIVKCGGGCQDGGQKGADPYCPDKGGWRTQRVLPAVRHGRENGSL